MFNAQNHPLYSYHTSAKVKTTVQELAKFKMELEADNAGITEILERRK